MVMLEATWKAFAKFLGRSVSFELTNLGVFLHLDLGLDALPRQ